MNIPGFSANASIYRNRAVYQGRSSFAGPGQGDPGKIQPALRPIGCRCFNTMKGFMCCCTGGYGDFRVTSCCNADGCDTF